MLKNNKPLLTIFIIAFLNLMGFGIIIPLLPYYAETFGAGATEIGVAHVFRRAGSASHGSDVITGGVGASGVDIRTDVAGLHAGGQCHVDVLIDVGTDLEGGRTEGTVQNLLAVE